MTKNGVLHFISKFLFNEKESMFTKVCLIVMALDGDSQEGVIDLLHWI